MKPHEFNEMEFNSSDKIATSFEDKYRPKQIFDHLPPLSSENVNYSDKPKVISRGPWTLAQPYQDTREFKRTSCSIAQNYSSRIIPRTIEQDEDINEETKVRHGPVRPRRKKNKDNKLVHITNLINKDELSQNLSGPEKKLPNPVHPKLPQIIEINKNASPEMSMKEEQNENMKFIEKDKNNEFDVEFTPWYQSTKGLSRPSSPEATDKIRYENILQNSFNDISMFAEFSEQFQNRIKSIAGSDLIMHFPRAASEFLEDAKINFHDSIKKAILDYILLSQKEQERLGLKVPKKPSLPVMRDQMPWHENTLLAKEFMKEKGYFTHPIILEIMTQFTTKYWDIRLINVNEIKQRAPLTLKQLVEICNESSIQQSKYLQENWLKECEQWINLNIDNIENIMPSDPAERITEMSRFMNCIQSLQSRLLRHITHESVCELLDLLTRHYREFICYDGEYQLFSGMAVSGILNLLKIQIVADVTNSKEPLLFAPSFDKISEQLCQIIDTMLGSVSRFHRLEKVLFVQEEGRLPYKTPNINAMHCYEEFVLDTKTRIRDVVEMNSEAPIKYSKLYKAFQYLLDKNAEERSKKFNQSEKHISDYIRELDKLKILSNEVASLPTTLPMHFFILECETINQWLLDRSNRLSDILLKYMADKSRVFNRAICTQYDSIVRKITKQSDTTTDLVGLQDYVEKLRTGELIQIKSKLEKAAKTVSFLLMYTLLPPDDILLNNTTFTWNERIIPIIESAEYNLTKDHDRALIKLQKRKQKFSDDLSALRTQLKEFNQRNQLADANQYVTELEEMQEKIELFLDERGGINKEEFLLGTGIQTPYLQLQEIVTIKEPYDKLWKTALAFHAFYEKWMHGPMVEVDAEEVEIETQNLWKTMYRLTKVFSHPDYKGPMKCAATVKAKLEKFKINLPLIQTLCNQGLKQRHWDDMSLLLGFDITPKKDTPLQDMLMMGLDKQLEGLQEVSSKASKEFSLEKALIKMKDDWKNVMFNFTAYKDTGVNILSAVDDIQVLLEDHLVKTSTMRNSPFIGPFEESINTWDKTLHLLKDSLNIWLRVQAAWLYLEPIFGSADIRRQIPKEGGQFEIVDGKWRKIMQSVTENPQVLDVIEIEELYEDLHSSEELLDQVQKGLNDYLEQKRLYFPRFFFLSNEELLEILSETKDPLRVQPHLKKCFEGISKLKFTEDIVITAMVSAENEEVVFPYQIHPLAAEGLVERWILQVEKVMCDSLRGTMKMAIDNYPDSSSIDNNTKERCKWVQSWPGQVVLAAAAVHWTRLASEAINSTNETEGLTQFLRLNETQLADIVELVRDEHLSNLTRITLEAFIVLEVHAKDVAAKLLSSQVNNVNDFTWMSQMRYYWMSQENSNGMLVIRMVTTEVPYGYEYLGNSSRLVITPLTDRCYRTLMGAIKLNLGGAPEGPAGTGKTETSKDLAKAVAKQCMVFNCSDGLDYKAMGKFFKGLAQSGAWACFDEFNRIELEVLSVIAQQIQTIQRAIGDQVEKFLFEGTELLLDKSCTIFITMNPGYAGRAELPDNLKVLFRTVAMMVPDYALIAEISLYSMGFVDARKLATKIVATYKLCSEQLSSQHHYDYGMRAVKSVLTAAGQLKLKLRHLTEERVVLKSIIDVNLPKFLAPDIPLFNGIISDLFPEVETPHSDYKFLIELLKQQLDKMKLESEPWFIDKTMQIYEMILVRHGLMIVGGTLSGKTSAFKGLAAALGQLSRSDKENNSNNETPVIYEIINPKAISIGRLYGRFDLVSHEWSDGVLAKIFREHASSTGEERKWIVFDGPVDAIWIENMNTVLDDNKKLCLMSGEIIQMNNRQNMVFEPEDLEQASPATVSRCGMIYMEPEQLGVNALVQSWIRNELPECLDDEQKETIKLLFEWLLEPCLNFVSKKCVSYVKCGPLQLTMNMLQLYSVLLNDVINVGKKSDDDDDYEDVEELAAEDDGAVLDKLSKVQDNLKEEQSSFMIAHFFLSLVWSIGSLLNTDSKLKFDEFFKTICEASETSPENPRPKNLKFARNLMIPKKDTVFDHLFYKKQFGSWITWKSLVEKPDLEEILKTVDVSNLIIPNEDTVRQRYFLNRLLHIGKKPLMFVGATGTGKTAVTKAFLVDSLPESQYLFQNMTFSAQTSADQVQDSFFAKLDRRQRGLYRPPQDKMLVAFIDDLSMPSKEKYGAQPPVEIIRQLLDHKFWFDRKDNSMLKIENILMVSSMAIPSASRPAVTSRLLRHFNIIAIDEFNDEQMKGIFQPIMDWHFNTGFDVTLKRLSKVIVHATAEIYRGVVTEFLPTPMKSHYVFNLRDFSRVIQGCLLMKSTSVSQMTQEDGYNQLIRLWVHECYRVFHDRLINNDDCEMFFNLIKKIVESAYKEKFHVIFNDLVDENDKRPTNNSMRRLIFGDFQKVMSSDPNQPNVVEPSKNTDSDQEKLYVEIKDEECLIKTIQSYLDDFNLMTKAPMDLVLFRFAIEHISRICRMLRQPNGHCLLIGIGGSGRQSAAKLATYICEYELFQIEMTRTYSMSDWRDDIRRLLRKTGEHGVVTTFLFGDYQIKEMGFLEDINMLLNSGDIPNLYENEEKLEIIEKMQQVVQQQNIQIEITSINMYNKFIERVRRNLHIALAFSPIGDAFHNRLRNFPSLINCCTIDWFQPWPEDALRMVAQQLLEDVEIRKESERETIVVMCQYFHESVRQLSLRFRSIMGRPTYITPTSYLQLIRTFKTLLSNQRLQVLTARDRYSVGLEKLEFSNQQIELMQVELQKLKPQLIITSQETEKLIGIIQNETVEVEKVRKVVKKEERMCMGKAEESKSIRDECEEKLSEAMPAMNAAISALDTLKQSDITIVKSMQNPPDGVKIVMEAVCILKSLKPEKKMDASGRPIEDYWPTAKKMLGDIKFLEHLKSFDKDNIPDPNMKRIRTHYMNNPQFDPSKIKAVSSACEGLCLWVRALEVYDRVIKVVAPKKKALAEADKLYGGLMKQLKVKQDELAEVEGKLDLLQKDLDKKQFEKEELEKNIELTKVKLERAEKLISGLGGEKERWNNLVRDLGIRFDNMVGDILLCSGIIAYLGAFIQGYRQDCISSWMTKCQSLEIAITSPEHFSLSSLLGDPVKIRDWQIYGLPVDAFSVDNAVIVTNTNKWPLMIDPQGQANKWVKRMEGETNKLDVIKLSDRGYLRILENCIQFGKPCLLENVGEELDSVLEGVLLKQTFKQSNVEYIRLGDQVIEYSPDFRFFMTTRLRNPHYLPEWSVKVTLVNFMITPNGLDDQLLGIVTALEKPELETRRSQLIVEGAANKRKLKEIEDQILEILSTSKGNILEDEKAIQVLSSSKVISEQITSKQKIANVTEKEINDVRDGYKPVASHGSILFFTISDLANIDPMYQYSLAWFINLYLHSIKNSEPSEETNIRIENLNNYFTRAVYQNVCRSLFEKDKLLFSFLLCIGILKGRKEIDENVWRFLLTGGIALNVPENNPASDWLSDKSWSEIYGASSLESLKEWWKHFINHKEDWKLIADSKTPHLISYPENWESQLSKIDKLVIIRCLCPEKIVPAVIDFITSYMGSQYVEPPAFDLPLSFCDSDCVTPLIFVISPGVDPMADLFRFAETRKISSGHLKTVSLGQGQGPIAEQYISESLSTESWVVLQNCHLATSWIPRLGEICEEISLKGSEINPEFRLWLTSYPSPEFPVSVLQNSVKMTNEPPKGLRANLLRSYSSPPIYDNGIIIQSLKPNIFEPLLFGLCFFHAVVQERRSYGAIGWNIPYEFNDSDLKISIRQLQMFTDDYDQLQLEALTYLTGECNYGGRVTDNQDRRLIMSLLSTVYCQQLVEQSNFSLSESGQYIVPKPSNNIENYLNYIRSIPMTTAPEVFGFNTNADIAKQQQETNSLFDGILQTLPRESSAEGKSSQAIFEELASDILSKLSWVFNIEETKMKYPVLYDECMNTVLNQELMRFNRLTNVIRKSLMDLKNAVRGLILMSSTLEEVLHSLLMGKVPQYWANYSYPSLKPLSSYVTDLALRIKFFQTWIDIGPPPVFWLSGFYFTQSFLTGVLQNYARRNRYPIDTLEFDFAVTSQHEFNTPADEGAYISGLYLECGRWSINSHCIKESHPKVLYDLLPIIQLLPKMKIDITVEGRCLCPVYKTSARRGLLSTTGHSTNYVLTISLPSREPQSHWINRGLAILCQLSE